MRGRLNMTNIRMSVTAIAFGIALLVSCLPAFAVDSNEMKPVSEITGIEIMDHAIKITMNGPIRYKINKPDDPFRAIVEIEGASIGTFKDKIYSAKPGVTEIAPLQAQEPARAAQLNILLPSPSSIDAEIKDGMLMLYIKEDTRTAAVAPDAAKIMTIATDPGPAEDEEDPARSIINVLFTKAGEVAELVIEGDGVMPDPAVFELGNKVVIEVPGVFMNTPLPSNVASPLKDVSYKVDQDKVRFILELERDSTAEVAVLDDELMVSIHHKDMVPGKDKAAASAAQVKDTKEVKETARLISLDFQDADVVPILRLLGDVSGYNIVVHPDVKGRVTMKLMNVPWEQALDIVLKTFGLERAIEGNVIRIATLKAFQDERKAIADTKEVFGKSEDIETRIFAVNYAEVDKIRESIEKARVLSQRGNISTDARTRSLLVKDIPSNIAEIAKIVAILDKATPQVFIEARIVEMNTNFAKDLGVQWGLQVSPTGSKSNIDVIGSASGNVLNSPGLTNLPVPASTTFSGGPTTAVTLGYLNAAQTFGLDLRLSAAETVGKAKVVSSPKIMTIENEKAEITHGTQIPVVTPGTSTTPPTVTYKDANLKLVVTPSVTPEGTVFMNMEITNDVPDFSRTIADNIPIDKREAKSKVLVKDGETIVIGGILKSREDTTENRVPGISKVPVLGRLFKRDFNRTEAQELLIFITPRIVKQEK